MVAQYCGLENSVTTVVLIYFSTPSPYFESGPILSFYGPESVLPMDFCNTVQLQSVIELPVILHELEFFP